MKYEKVGDEKKIRNFYDLKVWQRGHKLVLNVYKVIRKFPKEEKFTLVAQLARASSSVTANIAEGFSRYYFKDKTRFYYQPRGSISEVQNFLMVANDLKYINLNEFEILFKLCNEVRQLLNGLIRSTQNQI